MAGVPTLPLEPKGGCLPLAVLVGCNTLHSVVRRRSLKGEGIYERYDPAQGI